MAGWRSMLPRAIAMPHPFSLAGDGKDGFVLKGGDGTVIGAGSTRTQAAALVEAEEVAGGGQPFVLVSVAARERSKLSPRLGVPARTRTRSHRAHTCSPAHTARAEPRALRAHTHALLDGCTPTHTHTTTLAVHPAG